MKFRALSLFLLSASAVAGCGSHDAINQIPLGFLPSPAVQVVTSTVTTVTTASTTTSSSSSSTTTTTTTPAPLLLAGLTPTRLWGQPAQNVNTPNNGGLSASSLSGPQQLSTDGAGGFYVDDTVNNRVLHFNSVDAAADRVYGQASATTSAVATTASGLNAPYGVQATANGLYIADTYNNRVLHFSGTSTTADQVYGQPDFTTGAAPAATTQSSLSNPTGLALDPTATGFYVNDFLGNRTLHWQAAGSSADAVIGQLNFTTGTPPAATTASSLSQSYGACSDGAGGVYVADSQASRVLHFPGGQTQADRVYGQPNFTGAAANNGGVSASSLNAPRQVCFSAATGLYVADTSNNRVLHYPLNSTVADRVYGQTGFTSNAAGLAGGLNFVTGVATDASGALYVADCGNNRVLYFPVATSANK